MSISILPPEVIDQFRSGLAIISVENCVEELLLNSLDAESTCVALRIDLSLYNIEIIDNGHGMTPTDIQLLGERYATSKCHSLKGLNNLKYHGYRGEALSSIIKMSSIVKIVSRTNISSDTFVKIFKLGKVFSLSKMSQARPSSGTTINIIDFMYNMPVRKKLIAERLTIDNCKKQFKKLLLPYPNVSFSLFDIMTNETCLTVPKASSLLNRFSALCGQPIAMNIEKINYTFENFICQCLISTKSHEKNNYQFIFINKRLIMKTKLHKLLDDLISKLLIQKNQIYGLNKKNLDPQYAIFFVMLSCPYSLYDICFEPQKTILEFKDWDKVLKYFEKVVAEFKNKYFPMIKDDDVENSDVSIIKYGEIFQTSDMKSLLSSLPAKRPKLHTSLLNKSNNSEKLAFTIPKDIENLKENGESSQKHQPHLITLPSLASRPTFGLSKIRTKAKLNDIMCKYRYNPKKLNTEFPESTKMAHMSTMYSKQRISKQKITPLLKSKDYLLQNDDNQIKDKSKKPCTIVDLPNLSVNDAFCDNLLDSQENTTHSEQSIEISSQSQSETKSNDENCALEDKHPKENSSDEVKDNACSGIKQWLTCTDLKTGKEVYVDSTSGNSYYSLPSPTKPSQEQESLMNSYNVVKSRKELLSSEKKNAATPSDIANMFSKWKNPIFDTQNINSDIVSSGQLSTLIQSHNLSKSLLNSLEVIGQLDNKFIPCLVSSVQKSPCKDLLLLFDQHAVHERIRLEIFVDELLSAKNNCDLLVPVLINLAPEEIHRIPLREVKFERIGMHLSVVSSTSVLVNKVPPCLQHYQTAIQATVKELLQDDLELLPPTLLNLLKSQACHGAIKFGDVLDLEECQLLLKQLSTCKLPFQCAHGRPTCIPLLQLPSFSSSNKKTKPDLKKLKNLFDSGLSN